MKIEVLCIGNLKEKHWKEAIVEYSKRLKSYCQLEIKEIKETKLPSNPSQADEEMVKTEEGKSILKEIRPKDYVIALEIKGKKMSSELFAETLSNLGINGQANFSFVIGGSLGLSSEVLNRADMNVSFSDMTFPHQLMRVILLEQIYRAFKISKNEPYHK